MDEASRQGPIILGHVWDARGDQERLKKLTETALR